MRSEKPAGRRPGGFSGAGLLLAITLVLASCAGEPAGEAARVRAEESADGEASAGIGGLAESSSAPLPASYDYRKEGRAPRIGNQGELGTCWAFASLTALSSSLLPE